MATDAKREGTPAELVTCFWCKGAGTDGPAFVDYADGTGEFKQSVACLVCHGTGKTDPEAQARWRAGQVRYKDRLKRGVSLRDEAKRLGITARELSDIEHGRAPTTSALSGNPPSDEEVSTNGV